MKASILDMNIEVRDDRSVSLGPRGGQTYLTPREGIELVLRLDVDREFAETMQRMMIGGRSAELILAVPESDGRIVGYGVNPFALAAGGPPIKKPEKPKILTRSSAVCEEILNDPKDD